MRHIVRLVRLETGRPRGTNDVREVLPDDRLERRFVARAESGNKRLAAQNVCAHD
ncbi:MAG: hypothetical protein ABI837_03670 [Acidobacteriota bacterium]